MGGEGWQKYYTVQDTEHVVIILIVEELCTGWILVAMSALTALVCSPEICVLMR